MERLTDPCWKNLDPWECCGQDYYCKRGCHDKGGCTNGCIVPKLYARLAAYEDIAELCGGADRLRELAEADKDGRVVVLPPEERTLDFPAKYTEIRALYHFCVDLGIKCTIEHLYDGYAVRFPDGSDFAQHHGTYGGTEGCVEPAIGDSEFDYTAVGLNLAKELVKKHKGKLEADHA